MKKDIFHHFFKISFYVYKSLPVCMSVFLMYAWWLRKPGVGAPGKEVTDYCELSYRCRDLIPGPPEEKKPVLSKAEPSL